REQREKGVPALTAGQQAERIGADRQQADMAHGQLSGETDQQVQCRDQHPIDADYRRDMQVVDVAGKKRQHDRQQREQPDESRPDTVVLHTWRTWVVPNNPCGRTTRSRIKRPMAMVFWYSAPK